MLSLLPWTPHWAKFPLTPVGGGAGGNAVTGLNVVVLGLVLGLPVKNGFWVVVGLLVVNGRLVVLGPEGPGFSKDRNK